MRLRPECNKAGIQFRSGVSWEKTGEKEYRIVIKKEGSVLQQGQYEKQEQQERGRMLHGQQQRYNSLWYLQTGMGEGNDELGSVLMKGFIFAVSQLEELPGTILFYNGGSQTYSGRF